MNSNTNYTLILIWLGGLAAGCFLVATLHPWFAVSVFCGTLFFCLVITAREKQAVSEATPLPSLSNFTSNKPQKIM